MKLGKLIGVGVGPGAPDLMTIRAMNVLRNVPVLAIPRSNPHTPSMAWRTARETIGEVTGQMRMHLVFPMTKDPELLKPAWKIALDEIGAQLESPRAHVRGCGSPTRQCGQDQVPGRVLCRLV